MNRGSKVGIVVAGSFLALAGGSLAMRMLNKEPEAPPEVAQQTPTPPAETPAQPASPLPQNFTLQPVTPPAAPVDAPPPAPTWSPPAAVTPTPQPVNVPTPAAPEVKSPDPFPTITEAPKPIETPPAPVVPAPVVPAPVDTPKSIENATPPSPIVPVPMETSKTEEPKPQVPVTPVPEAPGAQLNPPSRPEGGSPSPLPASISNTGQSTGVAKPPSRPVSDSYLEEEYKVKAGDNMAKIAKERCFSEKYAQALQQYNRDHPLAGGAARQNSSGPVAGQVLWIPPIRVLEKKYPDLIPDFKPVQGQVTSAPTPMNNAAPAWTSANANSGARPVANSPGYKNYKVRDGGETMQEIARRTLGNTQAWSEVYRLNPSLNPSATTPIPAGTLLRLPSEARAE